MRYSWYYPWGGWSLLSLIPAVLFWLVLIFLFYRLFMYSGHHPWTEGPEKTPLDILKERYAKGEIDKKQFEEMKKDLEK